MRRITIALIALAVAVTACTPEEPAATTLTVGTNPVQRREPQAFSLVEFDACDDFLSYVREHALEMVTPWGLGGGAYPLIGDMVFAEEARAATADTAGGDDGGRAQAPQPGVDYSTTNVQELGVDEPDIVKTDGRRIVALSEQSLFVIDVTGSTPKLLGTLRLGDRYVSDMFLSGDTVLLLGANWGSHLTPRPVEPGFGGDAYYPYYESPTANLVEVDISDPTDIEIVRNLEMDGRYVSARLVGDTARVVVNSSPTGFLWEYPEGGGLRAERTALEANKEIIRNSTIDNWVPYFVMTDGDGDTIAEGNLVECNRAAHPVEFSGLDMLNVVTIDLGDGLDVVDTTGVLATGETVYASTDSLYVATQRWIDWAVLEAETEDAIVEEIDGVRTAIHQFDISASDRTEYVASGEITGFLLNQFAMSEHQGNLRVASTTSPNWWWGRGGDSESLVTVLAPKDGVLETIGVVDGLGKGEQIYSVRFIGDVGYVVTFRQTDPLYTIDLSDPTRPEVKGELKILGYSAYLHPLGDGTLLGIGQDADDQGRVKGTQVSLFDVSDITDPVRLDQVSLNQGTNSTVEYDHRAFLYWADTGLAVLPVQSWGWDEGRSKDEVFFGALAVDVDTDLEIMGRISHPGGSSDGEFWDWQAQIQRSVVVDGALYTVSAKGILKSDLNTLSEDAWVAFSS